MMYLVLFVLNDPAILDELLFAWEEVGVGGITILPSTGLGRIRQGLALQEDFPIFPSLSKINEHEETLSRTLFTVVEGEEKVELLVKNTEKVVGNLSRPDTGICIALPVAKAWGLTKIV